MGRKLSTVLAAIAVGLPAEVIARSRDSSSGAFLFHPARVIIDTTRTKHLLLLELIPKIHDDAELTTAAAVIAWRLVDEAPVCAVGVGSGAPIPSQSYLIGLTKSYDVNGPKF